MKSKDIKKIAEEYKSINGNSSYSNKDLLWYIIKRLDDLEKSDSVQDQELARVKNTQRILLILLPIGIAVLFYVTNAA